MRSSSSRKRKVSATRDGDDRGMGQQREDNHIEDIVTITINVIMEGL